MRESLDQVPPAEEALGPKERGISARLCGSELLTYSERNNLMSDYWAAEVARWRGVNYPIPLESFRHAEHRLMLAADLGLPNG